MPGFKKDFMTMPDAKGNQWARTGGLFGRNRATSAPTKAKQAPAANANPYAQAVNPLGHASLNIKSKMLQNPFANKVAAFEWLYNPSANTPASEGLGLLGATGGALAGAHLGDDPLYKGMSEANRFHKATRQGASFPGINMSRVKSMGRNAGDIAERMNTPTATRIPEKLQHAASGLYRNVKTQRSFRHPELLMQLANKLQRAHMLRGLKSVGLTAGLGIGGGVLGYLGGKQLDAQKQSSANSGPASITPNPLQPPPAPPAPPAAPMMYPPGEGPVTSQVPPGGQPMTPSPTTPQPMQADQVGQFPPMTVQASVSDYMNKLSDEQVQRLFK
jgi:hypothetical protein